jgi:hypothetical protein
LQVPAAQSPQLKIAKLDIDDTGTSETICENQIAEVRVAQAVDCRTIIL